MRLITLSLTLVVVEFKTNDRELTKAFLYAPKFQAYVHLVIHIYTRTPL